MAWPEGAKRKSTPAADCLAKSSYLWHRGWLGGLFIAQRMLFVAQGGTYRRGPIAWPNRPIYGTRGCLGIYL